MPVKRALYLKNQNTETLSQTRRSFVRVLVELHKELIQVLYGLGFL